MGSNECDIAISWSWVVYGDILLHSESQLVLMARLDSTQTLSDTLTADCMLDDAEMGHGSPERPQVQHGCWCGGSAVFPAVPLVPRPLTERIQFPPARSPRTFLALSSPIKQLVSACRQLIASRSSSGRSRSGPRSCSLGIN